MGARREPITVGARPGPGREPAGENLARGRAARARPPSAEGDTFSPMCSIPPDGALPGVVPKPPGTREFTLRTIIAAIVVAAVMGASYPYIVLKLGFGPNVSVVAAFFGYLSLGIAFRNFTRWENNIIQTAGTSAAQTAFMCVILAAFDFLGLTPPSKLEAFVWLFSASVLGILLAVPLRKHYVEDPDLTFADGVAAAETVVVLDSRGKEARAAATALFVATLVSGVVWLLTTPYGARAMNALFSTHFAEHVLPEVLLPTMFGLTAAGASAGFAVSLLGIGSGMIVGNRVNLSMAAGGVLAWIIVPKLLVLHQVDHVAMTEAFRLHVAGQSDQLHDVVTRLMTPAARKQILLWTMWPGTGMLIAAGLTALLIKWRTLARTFSTMSSKSIDAGEFPLAWVGFGVVAATVVLIIVQSTSFDVAPWYTAIAVLLSVPLMLVGLRVLGETNWGPISQLTNMMQAIFGALMPQNLVANLAASGTTGTIAVQSEAIIQDYKCGHIIGSTPRYLTYSQLIAAPIGAAAVAFMYPLLKASNGIGSQTANGVVALVSHQLGLPNPPDIEGLSSPISVRIAGFANVMAKGFDSLPDYALLFMVVGVALGILIALGEVKWKKFMPSATGLGIGMMVPGNVVFTMVVGGMVYSAWQRLDRRSCDQVGIPMASGLIAGEALAATVMSILLASGLVAQ